MRATAVAWIVNAAILGGIAGFAAGRFVVNAWGISERSAALGVVVLAATWLIAPLPETRGLTLEGGETGSSLPCRPERQGSARRLVGIWATVDQEALGASRALGITGVPAELDEAHRDSRPLLLRIERLQG